MIQSNISNLKNHLIVIFFEIFSNARSKAPQKAHNDIKERVTAEQAI